MFITREQVADITGVTVDQATLATAQAMIEAYVGRTEMDIVDASDKATLGRATMFQAVYINGQALDVLEQVAVKSMTVGSTNTTFDTSMMAPYLSPWAKMACQRVSWRGSRSVHTGPIRPYGGKTLGERWYTE